MQPELTCNQVGALMTFYMDDKLSTKLAEYVQHHLEICPNCAKKYNQLRNIMNKFTTAKSNSAHSKTDEFEEQFMTKQYDEFKSSLSAYIDNELSDAENIRIKKIAISNPLARQDLEDMYTFKKALHSSFNKTKQEIKNDFSKYVLSNIEFDEAFPKKNTFLQIMVLFFAIIACIAVGIIGMLYL